MWKDLSMGERAALIKIAVDSGVYSIDDIVNTYNSYAEGGELKDITPIRATPTLKKKSWETDEEYKERISSYSKVDTAAIIAENQRIIEENKRNRQQYLQTEEGKRRQAQIQEEDTKLFNNIKVPIQNTSSLNRSTNIIQDSLQSEVDKAKSLSNEIKEGAKLQQQERLDKLGDYKKGTEATITALELGLSGASLLGAYSNYKGWANAASATKRGIANFLQKAQLPMQVGGTLIDAGQAYDAIQEGNKFDTYYNLGSAALGTAGSIGASDIFLNSRFHNPKIDRILDTLGILQNTGDFVKFGYNNLTNNKYKDGGYKPSSSIRKRISNWEGSSMKTNRGFEAEARDFNASLPKGATSRLSQTQLDGLYSYSYNVGAGNFRKRVNPVLTRYLAGKATIQDVQRSMWASKDNQLRGLAKRRNAERAMLGNYTPMDFGPMSNTTTMMINHYLPETEPIEIPQLQFNDIINIPKPIELEPSTPYSSSDIDFSDPGSSLANALDIIQMIRRPRKINIYT